MFYSWEMTKFIDWYHNKEPYKLKIKENKFKGQEQGKNIMDLGKCYIEWAKWKALPCPVRGKDVHINLHPKS